VKENMISDKNIIKICLIGFFISLSFMIYFERNSVVEIVSISELSLDNLNEFVGVLGFVKSQSLVENNLFLEICDSLDFKNNSCIKVSLFDMESKLEYRTEYEVFGKVNYYNSELSIIARNLRKKY